MPARRLLEEHTPAVVVGSWTLVSAEIALPAVTVAACLGIAVLARRLNIPELALRTIWSFFKGSFCAIIPASLSHTDVRAIIDGFQAAPGMEYIKSEGISTEEVRRFRGTYDLMETKVLIDLPTECVEYLSGDRDSMKRVTSNLKGMIHICREMLRFASKELVPGWFDFVCSSDGLVATILGNEELPETGPVVKLADEGFAAFQSSSEVASFVVPLSVWFRRQVVQVTSYIARCAGNSLLMDENVSPSTTDDNVVELTQIVMYYCWRLTLLEIVGPSICNNKIRCLSCPLPLEVGYQRDDQQFHILR